MIVTTHTYLDLIPSHERFRLGNVIRRSLGTAIIKIEIQNNGHFLEYVTDIVKSCLDWKRWRN